MPQQHHGGQAQLQTVAYACVFSAAAVSVRPHASYAFDGVIRCALSRFPGVFLAILLGHSSWHSSAMDAHRWACSSHRSWWTAAVCAGHIVQGPRVLRHLLGPLNSLSLASFFCIRCAGAVHAVMRHTGSSALGDNKHCPLRPQHRLAHRSGLSV